MNTQPIPAAPSTSLGDASRVTNNDRLIAFSEPPRKELAGFWTLLRVFFLDLPVMLLVGGCMFLFWIGYVHDNYLVLQLEAARWTEERMETDMTYYARPCSKADMSTTSSQDLFLSNDATPEDAYQHQLIHGFTVFPQVLSEKTARNLRIYIASKNRNVTEAESNFVIANENRFSFGLGTETPAVAEAMTELTSNKLLKESIEKIMGENPALIEMTGE